MYLATLKVLKVAKVMLYRSTLGADIGRQAAHHVELAVARPDLAQRRCALHDAVARAESRDSD